MKFGIKRFIKFRFDFKTAVLLAILLHLLLFLIPDVQKTFLPILQVQPKPAQQTSQELDFKFVEVPDDKSEPNPDAPSLSDIDRRAASPEIKPEENANAEPIHKGQTPEAMLSRVDPEMQEKSEEMQKEKEGDADEKSEEFEDSIKWDNKAEWQIVETLDEKKARKIEKQKQEFDDKQNLSRENLNKYFKFQDFDNAGSSIKRFGGIQFDTKGFDFGKWVRDFYHRVYSNWTIPLAFQSLRQSGQLLLKFDVHRDGSVSGLRLVDTSGLEPYDDAALSAISISNPFLPLPAGYPDEKMEITCKFIYKWNPRPVYGGSRRRYR